MVDISSTSATRPIASKDVAETFEETNVQILGQQPTNGSIGLSLAYGNVVSRADDTKHFSADRKYGLKIEVTEDLSGIYFEKSNKTGSPQKTGYLYDNATGEQLASAPIQGQACQIVHPLTAGKKYRVGVGNEDGGGYVGKSTNSTFPISGDGIDILDGSWDITRSGDSGISGDAFAVNNLQKLTEQKSGTVRIEWPAPNDIYRWDAATFQATPDGETVEVYIEESSDGGSTWTEIQGPISRGDQIEAAPGSRVRFRVELARNDTSNNPTLDAIYRRWVV